MLDYIHRARPWQVGALLRVLLRYQPEETEVAGFRLWLDPSSNFGYRMLRDGYLERPMEDRLAHLLKPGDTFVDLGGNEGWFSLLAARHVGPKGRVLCVEPQERLWPVILRNASLNGFGNITLAPVAVGEGASRATITLAPGVNTGASTMARKPKPILHRRQEVIVKPLDELAVEHGLERIDVLKVDIEGYEHHALSSARRLLGEQRIRHIVMEFHEPQLQALGHSTEKLWKLIESYGYLHEWEESGVHHFRADGHPRGAKGA